MALVDDLNPSYPPISEIEREVKALYDRHKADYRAEIEAQGLEWRSEKGKDPWKGLFNYNHAEYRDSAGVLVSEVEAAERQARIWIWQEADASMPAAKQAASTRDPEHPNWRFYKPLHPVTQQPSPHPKSGWKFARADDEASPDRRSFESLDRDARIAWGPNEKKVPRLKRFLHEVETNIGKSVFTDYSDGEKQTSAMFGRSGIFLAPKHSSFVSRFIVHGAKPESVILDCFAGTGSTAHAVIDLNRADGGTRNYILAEVGEYFDSVLKPRVLKAIYSKDWRNGKPVSRSGSSHALKYFRLESYEDALMNVALRSPDTSQQDLLNSFPELKEDYFLHYALRAEAAGSPSLLAVDQFAEPFQYRLSLFRPGSSQAVVVDLLETFNWLLGLAVERVQRINGLHVIEGVDPARNRILVIWRSLADERHTNEQLELFLSAQGYLDRVGDDALDRIYVNGDCTLSRLRPDGAPWQVSLTEEAFQRMMFDPADMGRV